MSDAKELAKAAKKEALKKKMMEDIGQFIPAKEEAKVEEVTITIVPTVAAAENIDVQLEVCFELYLLCSVIYINISRSDLPRLIPFLLFLHTNQNSK